MTDEKITPALTAEEWEMRFVDWGVFYSHTGVRLNPHGGITVYNDGDVNDVATHQLPAVIALANHALPDTHPLKLGRDHVELLEDVANYAIKGKVPEPWMAEHLTAFAALVAALLPPRPIPPADD